MFLPEEYPNQSQSTAQGIKSTITSYANAFVSSATIGDKEPVFLSIPETPSAEETKYIKITDANAT